jgi:hypothetical protein
MGKMNLLSVGTNIKTAKGDAKGEYLTAILYMAPHKQNNSGVNLCPKATEGCAKACLYTAGRGRFDTVKKARIRKADWFISDRESFVKQLTHELLLFSAKARKQGLKPAVRLNGTTDIQWERYINMGLFPEITFYDYTKWEPKARLKACNTANYHLTYSKTEDTSDAYIQGLTSHGYNVAVVFSGPLPKTYLGIPVINGDEDDMRFLDPKGVIVGLSAKGDAKKDTSGFVIQVKNL